MKADKKTAAIVGILFITATVAGILSAVSSAPVHAPDYLALVSANQNQVMLGALLSLVMAVAVAGIAVTMYPVLRRHSEALALGYVGARIVEGVLFIITVISWLLLMLLSSDYVKAGAPAASHFQTLGSLLLGES